MTDTTFASSDDALRSGLEALDHLGEGEPDGIGIDHLDLDRLATGTSIEELVERTTSEQEWSRLQRPDYSTREIVGRLCSVKEAAAKALGVEIPDAFDWTELVVPRLAERPFRVRFDRFGDARIYVASMLVDRTAIATAARFADD